MTVTEMSEQIVQIVRELGAASFVDLTRRIGAEAKGDKVLLLGGIPNTVLWADVSQTFCDAYELVRERKQLLPTPTSVFTYHIDGGYLNLPLAKHLRGYKTLHWFPIVHDVREVAS